MALNQTSAEDGSGYLLISGDGIDGATAPAMTVQVGGKDGNGNLQTLLTDTSGRQIDATPDVVVTGTLTAVGQTVVATALGGESTWSVDLRGNGSGWTANTNIVFEYSVDGVNYLTAYGVQLDTDMGTPNNGTSGPTPTSFQGSMAGCSLFRVRVFAYQSPDQVVATIRLSKADSVIGLRSALPVGANTIGKVDLLDGSGNSITSVNSQLSVADIVNTSMTFVNKSVTTTATLINVSGTNMTNRKLLTIQPTNGIVYIGSTSSVTTTTGTPIYSTQTLSFSVGSAINIYAIAAATVNVCIIEAS